jgi:hypothetical protein
MDRLNDALDDFAVDPHLLPAVRMAAIRGRNILNKYYGKTDESVVFRIAMSKLFICLLIILLTC